MLVLTEQLGDSRAHRGPPSPTFMGLGKWLCLWIRKATDLWDVDHFAVGQSLMKYNTKAENAASRSEMVAPMNFQCQ